MEPACMESDSADTIEALREEPYFQIQKKSRQKKSLNPEL